MAEYVVHCALCHFAAMDMCDWDIERQCRQRCSVHFKSIAQHQQNVRAQACERLCKANHADANGFGNAYR